MDINDNQADTGEEWGRTTTETPLNEEQIGCIYIGHGEWVQVDPYNETDEYNEVQTSHIRDREPEWIHKWRTKVDKDIALHQQVWNKGYPNRWGAQVPVQSAWNLELFADLLQDYEDKEGHAMVKIWMAHRQVAYTTTTRPQHQEPQRSQRAPTRLAKIHHKGSQLWGGHGTLPENSIRRPHWYLTT